MTGKERIDNILNHKETDRIPWIPFAGIHAGKLINAKPREILTDADVLIKSLKEVKKVYSPDAMPIHFDLQVEAEILGCELLWSDHAPPSVRSHPLDGMDPVAFERKIPTKEDGRLPLFLKAMETIKKEDGDDIALLGLVCGPFTLASHLRGQNIFMDMMLNPDYVIELLDYTKDVAIAVADMYIEAGMDIVAVVDPLVSQISPAHFEQFLSKPFSEFFEHVHVKEKYASFFVCGNATNNVEKMCQTKPDMIAVDENVDMKKAKDVTDKYDVVLSGNIPLATLMLNGTQQENMIYTLSLIDSLTKKNLIISPGCDMPFDVPVENTVAVQQAIADPEKAREIVKNYEPKSYEGIEAVLPDYDSLKRPLIEVYTLDSESCAACTYMLGAALDVKEEYGDKIDIVEYKMLDEKTVPMMMKMGVANLPTMVINGKIEYISLIPPKAELFEKVNELF
jgi:uroporphyrinogen decarboxylase